MRSDLPAIPLPAVEHLMMRLLLALVPILLGGVLANPATAQATRLQEPWRWNGFTEESGLPWTDIKHVTESGDGTIWAGCREGLAWFDGFRWHPIPLPPPDPSKAFLNMEPGPGDSVVLRIGADEVYLASPRGLELIPLMEYSGRFIMDLVTVGDDRLVLTSLPNTRFDLDGWAVSWQDGRFEPFPLPEGHPARRRFQIRPDGGGGLWLWTDHRVQRWTAEGWQEPLVLPESGINILSLVGCFENEVWAWLGESERVESPGLYVIDRDGVRRHSGDVDHVVVNAAAQAPNGRVLIVYNTGELNLIETESSRRLDIVPLALRSVRDLHFDRNGNLWVATAWGVQFCRYSSDLWTRWIHPRPSGRNEVYHAQPGPDGSLWIASKEALEERGADGEVILHGGVGRPGPSEVTTFDFDESGALWAGGIRTEGGAWRYDGTSWEHLGADHGLSDQVLGRVWRDPEGTLWLLFTDTIAGNRRFREAFLVNGERFERWEPGAQLVGLNVRDLDGTGRDDMWFAMQGGVHRFHEGEWERWDEGRGLVNDSVISIAVDGQGRCWFAATQAVLGHLDPVGGAVELEPLPAEATKAGRITRAPDGTIWVSTSRSLAFHRGDRWRTIRSGPGWEDQTIISLHATDDFVFMSTRDHGVVRLSIRECEEPAPKLEILEPAVGNGYAILNWRAYPFMGAVYQHGGATRWSVDGGEWKAWSDREEVTLGDLGPGSHEFVVQARGRFGDWGGATSARSFELPLPLHRQPLFLIPVIGLSAILAIVLLVFALRSRRGARVLLESRNRFQTLAEVSPAGIFRTDRQGRITYVNRRCGEITGRRGGELLDYSWGEALHPEDRERVLTAWREAVKEEVDFSTEHRFLLPDGSLSWVICDAVPERDASGTVVGFIGTATEVTVRKKLEQQLRVAQRLESVGQLAGGVAHDFNNILQVILGCVHLAEEEADNHRVVESLREINRSTQRAADLARQLLAFSRQEAAAPAPLDLNGMIRGLFEMLRRLLPQNIEVALEFEENLGVVCADASQLEQVLINLCVNARDALSEGGRLTLRTSNTELDASWRRTHAWIEPGPFVCLSVLDDGVGISPEIVDRIFDPFFTTKGPGKGSGLGLSTSYGIAQQHGGAMRVRSRTGQGSAFEVYLPIVEDSIPVPEAQLSQQTRGGPEIVLIAEDEELVRQLARRVLEKAGYVVLEAEDGDVAVAVLADESLAIDLVLLDVVMPGRNGREVYEEVVSRRPGLRVLFTSGYSEAALPREFLQENGLGILAKPYRAQELLDSVRRVLDESVVESEPS